jgi:hypothetical protein
MKKLLKVLLIIVIIIAGFAGAIFGMTVYSDWKSKQGLKEQRERTRDALACLEYTVTEAFHKRATGDSYEYEWWEYKEGGMQADIDFYAWEKTDYNIADRAAEQYLSNLENVTLIDPIEDLNIGGIHGKRFSVGSKTVSDELGVHFATSKTIYYLDTEKGLLRIFYSFYDDNMLSGEDWKTNRCYTCQQEFFDSLKAK